MTSDIPDSDDSDPDDDPPGRGMLGVSIDEGGTIQMEHQFTGKTFEFDRSDLDEVIGVLASFRMMLEVGGDEEGNGKLHP